MKAHDYRDLIARYILARFGQEGLVVYTEVDWGRTIIGKRRRVDVIVLRERDQVAMILECKYQAVSGTTDEKIPYALLDLASLGLPAALVYAGEGWSDGVRLSLRGARLAAYCLPAEDLARSPDTLELDHAIAGAFGLWSSVLPEARKVRTPIGPGLKKVEPNHEIESAKTRSNKSR